MSLREDVWADKNSLTPPHFIQVSVPSPESERTYICVRGSIFPLSMIFHLDCGSVSTECRIFHRIPFARCKGNNLYRKVYKF